MQVTSAKLLFPATIAVILFGSLKYFFGIGYGSGFGEASLVTLWSVLLLGLTSWVCFRIAADCVEHDETRLSGGWVFWRFVGFSFAFLALDDALQLHEGLDKLIHLVFGIEETALTDRLDDLIVFAYVVVGTIILYRFRHEITRVPGTVALLATAVGLAVLSSFFDVLTNREEYLDWLGLEGQSRETVTIFGMIAEEGTKLLAGATLLFTFSRFYRVLSGGRANMPDVSKLGELTGQPARRLRPSNQGHPGYTKGTGI